jgi:hypothetical protein
LATLRAIAFHRGCLRALHDRGVLDRVQVISGVSGGSVLTALWAYSAGTPGLAPDLRGDDLDGPLGHVELGGDLVLREAVPDEFEPCCSRASRGMSLSGCRPRARRAYRPIS